MLVFPDDDGDNTAATQHDRLGVLPDELLLQIFETLAKLGMRKDLCNVSRLNKRYHRLSDATLYKQVLFQTPELHLTFSESLGRRPRRGSAINEVTLAYPSSELSQLAIDAHVPGSYIHPSRFDGLSRTLSIMSNLEKLDIAVPDTLLRGIGSLFNGPFDLSCLKSCKLFYQCPNNDYWDLRENIHIFAHPELEELILRRAKLDEQGFNFLERPHETALKKLHLIECDINDDGLGDLLELPEALEEFVMTHAEEPEPELEESSDNVADYINALKSQSESLISITIDSPSMTSRKVLRMREFGAVKTLRLNWDYQLFGKSSKKPRLHSVGLPPELEMLEFFNELGTDTEVNDLLLVLIESKSIVARRWKTMVVVEGDEAILKQIKIACKEVGLQLDIIGAFDEDTESENDDQTDLGGDGDVDTNGNEDEESPDDL